MERSIDPAIRVESPRDDPEASSCRLDVVTPLHLHRLHHAPEVDVVSSDVLPTAPQWQSTLDSFQPLLLDSTRYILDQLQREWTPAHQQVDLRVELDHLLPLARSTTPDDLRSRASACLRDSSLVSMDHVVAG